MYYPLLSAIGLDRIHNLLPCDGIRAHLFVNSAGLEPANTPTVRSAVYASPGYVRKYALPAPCRLDMNSLLTVL